MASRLCGAYRNWLGDAPGSTLLPTVTLVIIHSSSDASCSELSLLRDGMIASKHQLSPSNQANMVVRT